MIDSNETLAYENGRDAGYLEGYAEGYENGLNSKIKIIDLHPTEAVVLSFNFNDYNLYDMRDIFESVKNQLPNNTIIAIPDKISLKSCSKDVLENIISMIAEIIEEL